MTGNWLQYSAQTDRAVFSLVCDRTRSGDRRQLRLCWFLGAIPDEIADLLGIVDRSQFLTPD